MRFMEDYTGVFWNKDIEKYFLYAYIMAGSTTDSFERIRKLKIVVITSSRFDVRSSEKRGMVCGF